MRHWFAEPLPFGRLMLGQADYMEFVCSHETFAWLRDGGMTHLDGVPVRLQVMDVLVGGANVLVKIHRPLWAAENAFELDSQYALEPGVAV